jgi:DNA-binding CsgD family transcriptional regulator/tetratricopeptide (TPR) repeat protein
VPLRPVTEALTEVARAGQIPDTPEMAAYRPALAWIVPAWSQAGEREAEMSPLILGEALQLLLAVPGSAGALLVLEDLQWADPETLAVVEYLADSLAGRRVLCVATLRDSEPSAALDMVSAVQARRAATVAKIPRLAGAEIERMAAACLGQETAPQAVTGRLLRDCDGLPFAVEEVLAAAVTSGQLVSGQAGWRENENVTTGVPTSLAGSVRSRLDRLGPMVADVVVSAAVLGRQFDWTLLPAVTGMTEPQVLTALRRACEVQLIEPDGSSQVVFRFRHSLTREAIVADLLPIDLTRRSAAAAAVIEDARPGLPGACCELAAELHEAAGQLGPAATLLLEAGRRALHRGALTSAGASLRKARRMLAQTPSADADLVADIDDTLTTVLMLAGDCDQMIPVAERLLGELDAAGADTERKAVIRLRVARSLSEGGRVTAAERQISAARHLTDGLPDPALGGWTDAVAARCAINAGELDRALDLASRALASAKAAAASQWSAKAACDALEVIGRRERFRDIGAAHAAFEDALAIASGHGLHVRRIQALHELGTIEMLEGGGSAGLAEARRLALDSGVISTATVLDLQLASAWCLGADTDRALAAARRCQQAARQLRMRRVEAMAVGVQACLFGIRGDRIRAELTAAHAEHLAPGNPAVLATAWEARATAAIFADDLARALEASTTAMTYARKEPLTAASLAWGYWPLLEAACGQAGHAAVAEAREAGVGVAHWNRGCLAYAEAVLQGRDGRQDLATGLAEEGAAELAEEGRAQFPGCAPWWNHILRRMVAPAAFGAGWGEPATWLRYAIGDLDTCGLDRLASACRGILRRAGERVPRSGRGEAAVPAQLRWQGVTSREMDVFLLVGQGRSTADIARRLFISPKTVETHIASLVSKTGLANRRELTALASNSAHP